MYFDGIKYLLNRANYRGFLCVFYALAMVPDDVDGRILFTIMKLLERKSYYRISKHGVQFLFRPVVYK